MKRDFKEARKPEWRHEKRVKNEDGTWTLPDSYSSPAFEEYYREQGIVPEGEWQEYLEILKSTLPTTFRINAGTKFAMELRRKLETDLFSKFHDEPVIVRFCSQNHPPPSRPSTHPRARTATRQTHKHTHPPHIASRG
jgi:16S rRNA C967 or C1407 C5-methylase (RsmB/RsmF family)